MGCCNCCCAEGEECCHAPGPEGICCTPERCCGTPEAPVCCAEGENCCDGVCQEEPCEEECSGPCDSGCWAAYCCSIDGQCGPDGDGCADFLGCAERWNSPAYFATSAEAQAFADEFNANNPNTSPQCGMQVFRLEECPEEAGVNPCAPGCVCVAGECVESDCFPCEDDGNCALFFCEDEFGVVNSVGFGPDFEAACLEGNGTVTEAPFSGNCCDGCCQAEECNPLP